MPPFNEKLSAEEIDAVIAWFQSLWSDEIYTVWVRHGRALQDFPTTTAKQNLNTKNAYPGTTALKT